MNRHTRLLVVAALLMLVTACGALSLSSISAAAASQSAAAITTFEYGLTPTPSPTPFLVTPKESAFWLEWPPEPFTTSQLTQVRDCEIDERIADRYDISDPDYELPTRFYSRSACYHAALAGAYAYRGVDVESYRNYTPEADPPTGAINAFARTVRLNPAFALAGYPESRVPFFTYYMDTVPLVEPPPFTDQPVTQVKIDLFALAMVDSLEYVIDIEKYKGEQEMFFRGVVRETTSDDDESYEVSGRVSSELVQVLGGSMQNLLPIDEPLSLMPGISAAVNWTVTLTFEDGTEVEMVTHRSIALAPGGPWQTEIDDQHYMQFSYAFSDALLELIRTMGLPTPTTSEQYDHTILWADLGPIMDAAFPDRRLGGG